MWVLKSQFLLKMHLADSTVVTLEAVVCSLIVFECTNVNVTSSSASILIPHLNNNILSLTALLDY